MDMMLWNIVLTAAFAAMSWFAKTMWAEQQRLSILLNRTREEYVTKAEVHNDINRVIDRLEALDAKLDRIMEGRAK